VSTSATALAFAMSVALVTHSFLFWFLILLTAFTLIHAGDGSEVSR
jgi:hypothetical protein